MSINCSNFSELRILSKRIPKPIVQEYLKEPEYTIDLLSDLHARPLITICRRRVRVKAGVTWQGFIDARPEVSTIASNACRKLGLTGPSCMQVRFRSSKTPRIFEVNPRIGGTTILSVAAGVNIPYLAVKQLVDGVVRVPKKPPKRLHISRFFGEVFYEGSNSQTIVISP